MAAFNEIEYSILEELRSDQTKFIMSPLLQLGVRTSQIGATSHERRWTLIRGEATETRPVRRQADYVLMPQSIVLLSAATDPTLNSRRFRVQDLGPPTPPGEPSPFSSNWSLLRGLSGTPFTFPRVPVEETPLK